MANKATPCRRSQRDKPAGQAEPGFALWLTGLPSSGKSTLARLLKERLEAAGRSVVLLDGDELRKSVSKDLGFSRADREEQIRRVGELCREAVLAGRVAIAALISPYREAREKARRRVGRFYEIFVDCGAGTCARRDPKGLYERARRGEIQAFTGVSDPYEPPLSPEVWLKTERETPEECVLKVLDALAAES